MTDRYVRERFALDDLGEWDGIHDPTEWWNGFACPLFHIGTVREIAAVVNALPGNDEIVIVSTDGRVFTQYVGGPTAESPEELHGVAVDGQFYYALGSHGWVWDIATDGEGR